MWRGKASIIGVTDGGIQWISKGGAGMAASSRLVLKRAAATGTAANAMAWALGAHRLCCFALSPLCITWRRVLRRKQGYISKRHSRRAAVAWRCASLCGNKTSGASAWQNGGKRGRRYRRQRWRKNPQACVRQNGLWLVWQPAGSLRHRRIWSKAWISAWRLSCERRQLCSGSVKRAA